MSQDPEKEMFRLYTEGDSFSNKCGECGHSRADHMHNTGVLQTANTSDCNVKGCIIKPKQKEGGEYDHRHGKDCMIGKCICPRFK